MKPKLKIVSWKGPKGWTGEALPKFRGFPFARLPWVYLRKEGQESVGAVCVKSSNSRRVYRVTLSEFEGGQYKGVVYAKRYLANNLRRQLGVRLTGTKASHEFNLGVEMLKAGLVTPRPLAWAAHMGSSPCTAKGIDTILPPASYLLTLEWPNEGSSRNWLKDHPAEREFLIPRIARFLAEAHHRGFYHDDCSAEHILVRRIESPDFPEGDLEFCFIDVDNGRMYPSPLARRQRTSSLFQVLRSLPIKLLSSKQRIALLEEYLAHSDSTDPNELDRLIASIEQLAERKVGRKIVRP